MAHRGGLAFYIFWHSASWLKDLIHIFLFTAFKNFLSFFNQFDYDVPCSFCHVYCSWGFVEHLRFCGFIDFITFKTFLVIISSKLCCSNHTYIKPAKVSHSSSVLYPFFQFFFPVISDSFAITSSKFTNIFSCSVQWQNIHSFQVYMFTKIRRLLSHKNQLKTGSQKLL